MSNRLYAIVPILIISMLIGGLIHIGLFSYFNFPYLQILPPSNNTTTSIMNTTTTIINTTSTSTSTAPTTTILPPSVSISPLSSTVNSGDSESYTASASGGTDSYTYTWYTDGLTSNGGCGTLDTTCTISTGSAGIYNIAVQIEDSSNIFGSNGGLNESVLTVESTTTSTSTLSTTTILNQSEGNNDTNQSITSIITTIPTTIVYSTYYSTSFSTTTVPHSSTMIPEILNASSLASPAANVIPQLETSSEILLNNTYNISSSNQIIISIPNTNASLYISSAYPTPIHVTIENLTSTVTPFPGYVPILILNLNISAPSNSLLDSALAIGYSCPSSDSSSIIPYELNTTGWHQFNNFTINRQGACDIRFDIMEDPTIGIFLIQQSKVNQVQEQLSSPNATSTSKVSTQGSSNKNSILSFISLSNTELAAIAIVIFIAAIALYMFKGEKE